jgi:hypothetical protein
MEPWSVQGYPETSPPSIRIYLPDGFQYGSDASDQGAPAGYVYGNSRLSFNATPLYDNGDNQAAEISLSGSFGCTSTS